MEQQIKFIQISSGETQDRNTPETRDEENETSEVTNTKLSDLPEELILAVLSNLSLNDLLEIGSINKHLLNLGRSNFLWKEKLKLHFPPVYNELQKNKSQNYLSIFARVYQDDYKYLSPEHRKLYSLIKEGQLTELLTKHKALEVLIKNTFNIDDKRKKIWIDWLHWFHIKKNQAMSNYFYHLVKNDFLDPEGNLISSTIDNHQYNLLHWAVYLGQNKQTLMEILEVGMDIHQPIKSTGITPLYLAAQNGYTNIVELLLQRNAKVNQVTEEGLSALYVAVQNGHTEVVRLLFKYGAVIDKAKTNATILLFMATQHGYQAIIELLLEHGAKVDLTKTKGAASLYLAVQNGYTEIVKLLFRKSAKVDMAKSKGATLLYAAAQNGHKDIVQLLLEHGAQIDQAKPKKSITSLYAAAQNGHKEIVKLLLEHGAQIDQVMTNGATPLCVAVHNGHVDIVKLLLERGAQVNKALINNHTGKEYVERLYLKKGSLVSSKNVNLPKTCSHISPLFIAVFKGYSDIVKILLEYGADANQIVFDNKLPIHISIEEQDCEITKMLLFVSDNKFNSILYDEFNANVTAPSVLLSTRATLLLRLHVLIEQIKTTSNSELRNISLFSSHPVALLKPVTALWKLLLTEDITELNQLDHKETIELHEGELGKIYQQVIESGLLNDHLTSLEEFLPCNFIAK